MDEPINKNCGIYKITSPKGRAYIGQSKDLKRRFSDYKGLKCKGQKRLYESFKKYGVNAHQFDIIEYCSEEVLDCSERFWQDIFNVLSKDGLNCVLQECGEKRKEVSQETKKKISDSRLGEKHHFYGKSLTQEHKDKLSEANRGKVISDEARKKLSIALKGRVFTEEHLKNMSLAQLGEKSAWYGRTHTDETKQKMSQWQLGGDNHQAKLVLDLDTGIFYETAIEAVIASGMNRNTFYDHLLGKRKKKVMNYIYV